jgi:phospholipid/cholesterol/gamma-HCH transport system permease protein
MMNFIARVGGATRAWLADVGHATALFVRLILLAPACLRRFGLVRDHMHFLGNYSLAIISVSGLFVGFVLALQGYNTLQRFGSASALGLLVTLSLVRELGPVISALLFTGRAGTSLTAEIGLMKAGEQLSAMDMMAVDLESTPDAAVGAPVELWGERVSVDEVAASAGTIGYELLCAVAPRVPMHVVD